MKRPRIFGWFRKLADKFIEPITPPSIHARLYFAAGTGDIPGVKRLLAAGADPNFCSENGLSCLHQAALKGSIEACRALLEAGADPNKATGEGWTPLHVCLTLPCAAVLLEAGSDPNLPDNAGLLPEETPNENLAALFRSVREMLALDESTPSTPGAAQESKARPRL